jgi:transposase-like protein
VKNVSVLVAIGVNEEGYRQVLRGYGRSQGGQGQLGSVSTPPQKPRAGRGAVLIVSDKCLRLVETEAEFYPAAKWQRCLVDFYRNVWRVVPTGKVKEVAAMLKAIHTQEDKEAARKKAADVVEKLKAMKLAKAGELVKEDIEETLHDMDFPREHWRNPRTDNLPERIMREIRCRTRVVGAFPDDNSALMLVAARLRHVEATRWSSKRYLDMNLFKENLATEDSKVA